MKKFEKFVDKHGEEKLVKLSEFLSGNPEGILFTSALPDNLQEMLKVAGVPVHLVDLGLDESFVSGFAERCQIKRARTSGSTSSVNSDQVHLVLVIWRGTTDWPAKED